jgi:hypothetical protein
MNSISSLNLNREDQKLTRDWFFEQFFDLFFTIYSLCNKTHPQEMETAYTAVRNNLLKIKNNMKPVSEPLGIIFMLESLEKKLKIFDRGE